MSVGPYFLCRQDGHKDWVHDCCCARHSALFSLVIVGCEKVRSTAVEVFCIHHRPNSGEWRLRERDISMRSLGSDRATHLTANALAAVPTFWSISEHPLICFSTTCLPLLRSE